MPLYISGRDPQILRRLEGLRKVLEKIPKGNFFQLKRKTDQTGREGKASGRRW